MGHQHSCHTTEPPAAMLTPSQSWEGCQLPEREGSPTERVQKQGGSCQNRAGVT